MVRYESNCFVWVSFPHHIIVQQIEVVAISVIHFVIASKIKYRTVGVIGPPF
jgi:hypothetical protein